jgi:hypothetical protein
MCRKDLVCAADYVLGKENYEDRLTNKKETD